MNHLTLFISHNGLLVAGFVLVAVLLIINELSVRFSGIQSLAPDQLVHWLNRKEAVVIDVRDVAAFKGGHIVNAINVPRETLVNALDQKLSKHKSKPVVVYCANGQNSAKAAGQLRKNGFTEVAYLRGGLAAWRSASLPVTKN